MLLVCKEGFTHDAFLGFRCDKKGALMYTSTMKIGERFEFKGALMYNSND